MLEFCFLCVGNFYVETFKVSGIRNNMNFVNKIIMDLHKLLIYLIVLIYHFNSELIYGSIRKSLCIIIKGFIIWRISYTSVINEKRCMSCIFCFHGGHKFALFQRFTQINCCIKSFIDLRYHRGLRNYFSTKLSSKIKVSHK